MWNVILKFGPLRVWSCRDPTVTAPVVNALRHRLLRIALSKRLPGPARDWAQAKLAEMDRLDRWKGES